MPDLVSIALCTFNGERFLAEQLDSLLAQEGVPFEIVVVDDQSSDGTPEMLARYARQHSCLRWQRSERNLGPTASFEIALSRCRGNWLAPCDQDDIWHPKKLVTLLQSVGDADLAYCDSQYIDASGAVTGETVSRDLYMMQGADPVAFLFANSVSGHASLLRSDLFHAARPFPEGVFHDWWLALCAAGHRGIRYVDQPLVQFRRHAGAFSSVGKPRREREDKATASRRWLEEKHRLMDAYGRRTFHDAGTARLIADAMRAAIDGGAVFPLLKLIWLSRKSAPYWRGVPAIDALKLQVRMGKKLRRLR